MLRPEWKKIIEAHKVKLTKSDRKGQLEQEMNIVEDILDARNRPELKNFPDIKPTPIGQHDAKLA